MDLGGSGAFAAVLRRYRVAAGLTQEELAERSGISTRAVSDLERAISQRPHDATAALLADGLGLAGPERQVFLAVARNRRHTPPPRSAYPRPPKPAAPLLGRAHELWAIEEALLRQGVRLLTLAGPGGVGKTRLATEAAHELADRFADGAVFVRLDGLNDPTLVLPTLAAALLLLEAGAELSLSDRIAAHLADRKVLIVLDNLEHLLTIATDLTDLLRRAPEVSVLVTSRESLRVGDERVVNVAPLPPPSPAMWQAPETVADVIRSPAVALFVQRALAVRPDLPLDPATPAGRANLAVIAETCHRLDGLPLAIELAAAQAQLLSPAAILTLLKRAGLPLLATGGRDQPARLRTMDAAIAWSYNLLPPAEQELFRTLSVFAAGFTLPAAAAVSGATNGSDRVATLDPQDPLASVPPGLISAIVSLGRQNLLFQETAVPDHAAPRFRMLEPIRLFALDRLRDAGEEFRARLRHATFFARLAEELDALTLGPDPEIWLRQQVLDLDNFRTAYDWALAAARHELVVQITCYIAQLWEIRGGLSEARRRVSRALAVDATSPPVSRWFLRFWAGTFALDAGDVEEAVAHARELLAIAEAAGEPLGIGVGLALLSRAVGADPDGHREAAKLARRAVDALEPLGWDEWTGWAWSRLGIEYHLLGRLPEARACQLRSLEVRRRKRCEGCVAYSLASLATVSLDLGEPIAAADAYRECVELTAKHENYHLFLTALLGLADLAWRFREDADQGQTALLLFGAAEALRKRHGLGRNEAAREAIAGWLRVVRRAIGDDAADRLIGEGTALPLRELVEVARRLRVADRPAAAGRHRARPLLIALGSLE